MKIKADSREYLFPCFLLLIVFVAVYYRTFLWLNYKYLLPESYYSHGYLIPFVSVYLIYTRRNDLRKIPLASDPLGLVLVAISLLLHILAILGNVNFVSAFSIMTYATGCSLFLFGRALRKAIAFPLFFLVFMLPVPDAFTDIIGLPLKSMATTCALEIIDAMGIPYIREGFRIHFTDSSFLVGTPCNGMRSLISFLALGSFVVYFIRTTWWKRSLFLIAVLPLSILLNGLRIAVLLLIAKNIGQQAVSPESYLHDGSGLVVFVIGLMVMVIFIRNWHEG